ncbi:hypothetical protein BDN70DRAFT_931790 [Pholiota conissans]|uniref:Uncharacterized protein n=1 Tax=Pholiota conissans TaxID=109636 RepID=A0A9P5Z5E2_9AGAR|nr:hypothetical protein BDN70DRAFT_931790 [Pholiota conissans]
MFSIKSLVYATVAALLVTQSYAVPSPQTSVTPVVHHCANGVDTCPKGWTCCGPLLVDVGGTCRLLGKGEVCIF